MNQMFRVRSPRLFCPRSAVDLPLRPACTAVACRLPPPSLHLALPSFRLSAERVGVQPAAELRHL
eukprot:scaffold703_cov56-Phaeocystis_antarctica.AAC.4